MSKNCPNYSKHLQRSNLIMPEFISSPIFLIIAAVFAIFLIIGIIKHAFRFVILIAVVFVILLGLGIVKQSEVLQWFENLRKIVE